MPGSDGKVWAVCPCCGDRLAMKSAPHMETRFIGKRCQLRWCIKCGGPCRGTYQLPNP